MFIGVHVTLRFWDVLPDAFDNSSHFLMEMQEFSKFSLLFYLAHNTMSLNNINYLNFICPILF